MCPATLVVGMLNARGVPRLETVPRSGQTSVNASFRRSAAAAHAAAGGKCTARGTRWGRPRACAGHAAPRHLATAAEVRQLNHHRAFSSVAAG